MGFEKGFIGRLDRGSHYLVEVSLHELKNHVDVLKFSWTGGQHDVLDLNNVYTNKDFHHLTCRWSVYCLEAAHK